ncbi:unnamed protein product [Cercopithifilaria johnstoni]|uniref:Uncharacterized protein n=1 Tax=Cercopithifilaria johnstoni TaxID=2874296 RepID=A0A8J2M230_9BILA|nr:unnamed protein product [Cercopithifilaria johnstoni]
MFRSNFINLDTTKSLGETVKQFTADSDRWIFPKNGQNTVFSQHQVSSRFNAASIIDFLGGIMQILSKNRPNLQINTQQSPMKLNWNLKRYFEPISATNDYSQKRQPLAYLDTGGNNFDRFIVSERRNDNPILDWIVGKFSRRGLDWSSGNLRLINVQGNSILGSDLIVHDRSIEIPFKKWLYTLNSILKSSPSYK